MPDTLAPVSAPQRGRPRGTTSIMDFDRRLARIVRERRIALGISQQQLAAAIGVAFQQVQKYERATNRISAGKLDVMASTLETSGAELMRLASNGEAIKRAEERTPQLGRMHMEIARAAAAAPPALQRAVLNVLKAARGAA